jgi:hypothetical protein
VERCITFSFEGASAGRFSGTIPENCGYHPPAEEVGYKVFLGYIPPKVVGAKQVILTAKFARIRTGKNCRYRPVEGSIH